MIAVCSMKDFLSLATSMLILGLKFYDRRTSLHKITPLGCISRDPAPKSHMAPLLIWAVSNGKPYVLYCFVIRNSWYLEIWWNLSSFRKEVFGKFLGIRYISVRFTEIGRNKRLKAVRVLAVACGENSTVALMSSGELYSWGTSAGT